METRGSATVVLHTHLPYCRLAGRWPHGEEWIHEAMLECYLPLLQAFHRLAAESRASLGVTINITPILAEQLVDPIIKEHFREYLADRIERAECDVIRFSPAGGPLAETAAFHRDRYRATRAFFEDTIGADIVGALAELETAGRIEIASCAATHGYLPLLDDDAAVRFQVAAGIESHIRHFGRRPRSFWLPECAYEPGLERVLDGYGLRAFFVETHLVAGGPTRGKAAGGMIGPYPPLSAEQTAALQAYDGRGTTFEPYRVRESNVAVIARNERTGKQVWSADQGYPGDGAYREFHKKDDQSGLHYWRVTGPSVGLGEKAEYDQGAARALAREHAAHFAGVVSGELDSFRRSAGHPGLVLAAYDTELFGHWWLEGVDWLEESLRQLAATPGISLATVEGYLGANPPQRSIELPEGSWGAGGDHRTWMNEGTAWTWPEIHARQRRAAPLFARDTAASRQLARELLLLQASDWQFLMTTGQAKEYATERFRSHCQRFDALAAAIEGGIGAGETLLAELEQLDNPFPAIRPSTYGAGPTVNAAK